MRERFKQVISVGIILVNKNNEVLLQKRCNTGYMDGKYALVAGHLEPKESMLSGVIREIKEEIGVELEKEKVSFVCLVRRGDDNEYINTYFKYEGFDGEVTNMEPDKCSELKWFDINDLPSDIVPNDKHAIYNMLNNITLDEYDF